MSLEEDARRLVIDGERVARESCNPLEQKAALQPQYGLYLKVLSRSQRPKTQRAEDYVRVVRAMREEQEYAGLEFDEACIVGSPLRVLAAYLEPLEATAVLMIESGAGVLTLFALRSGNEPLEERITLERASKECVASLLNLLRRQDDDIRRIGRGERITKVFFDPIEQAASALWAALPTGIQSAIGSVRSLLYLPSAFGDLSAFPLELLRMDARWVGTTHAVSRLSSLRTLFELLSPGRMPSRLDARALVVRAQDSEELINADAEAKSVHGQVAQLGLVADFDRAPRVDTFRAALNAGLRVLHYCGHGFAGKLGESLPLGGNDVLRPYDFSQLSGWGTPFVYLSTCEVGRARMTTTGCAVGFATRLIEKGAPAVVGCLASVPDLVAQSMATSFYQAAATRPVGEALAVARRDLMKYPPACWGAFALFGDPNLRLCGSEGRVTQTRGLTFGWHSLVGRHIAVRTPESRRLALNAVAKAQTERGDDGDRLAHVACWLASSFSAEEPSMMQRRLDLCHDVAKNHAVAGAQLRILLAMEALKGCYCGKHKPDVVINPEELAVGLQCAKGIHDTLAWAAFAIESTRGSGMMFDLPALLNLLDEAAGILEGWQLEEPSAAILLSIVQDRAKDLRAIGSASDGGGQMGSG